MFTRDHPPPHVHVAKAGAMLKIDLTTCEVVSIAGRISDRDIRRAERLVEQHQTRLQQEWEGLHGRRTLEPKRS